MTPLVVTAHLRGSVSLPNGAIAIDGLVGYAVVLRSGLPMATCEEELVPIDIPIARSACGRVYLASVGAFEAEEQEKRWTNRRFPVAEAMALGEPSFRRINISAGAQKSYRLPLETMHLRGDVMTWWCVGDREELASLLRECIGYLGKRRAVGHGPVARWEVEPCEPWDGFPVVRDGRPLRPLPLDWPGLAPEPETAYRVLQPPYWRRNREELCAVPAWT